ncbi:hypothetical protein LXL04_022651 [Taraxacum kok-saghyz]
MEMEEQNLELNSDDIEELHKLEEDVKSMSQKIAEFRETLPDHLKNTLASIIAAHRPANLTAPDDLSDPGPSDNLHSDATTPFDGKMLVENDQKVEMIKKKICENAKMMPLLVNQMKHCMSRIDTLQPFKQDVIHSAFTRKPTT